MPAVIFDDGRTGLGEQRMIQGHFGGAGHCSISLPAMMLFSPNALSKGRSRRERAPHAELKTDPTIVEVRVLAATSDEAAADRTASPVTTSALLPRGGGCVGRASGLR